jgi:hypothetical protein
VGGALGAAVVAGLLLSLDAGQLEDALGLAASGACGLSSYHREPLHQIKSEPPDETIAFSRIEAPQGWQHRAFVVFHCLARLE